MRNGVKSFKWEVLSFRNVSGGVRGMGYGVACLYAEALA